MGTADGRCATSLSSAWPCQNASYAGCSRIFRANGNCVELRERGGDGRSVYFLHLSELPAELAVGMNVEKGQVVARSGNTGHSFAPHLHYQLMSAKGVVLDPFTGPTYRRALPDADRPRFDAEMRGLDALLPPDGALAGR